MDELAKIPAYAWIILGLLLLAQGSWIFLDASRRGEMKWIWGLYGLLNVPSSLIVYLVVTRLMLKHRPCPNCGKNVRSSFAFCPHCGSRTERTNPLSHSEKDDRQR